mmetsp:Transcript_27610/g.49809  ORF Transcript_27610/g.49809 Transcript_27610/m.49809 type:complete len:308 (-) Transcript_27610:2951-3874(-)
MEFVLHTCYSEPNPVTYIAKAWATLCQIREFREVESAYDYNGVGPLPVLRYGHYVFEAEHIVALLRLAFDLDFELTETEREESRLIEELLYSKLHPATLYALWNQGSPGRLDQWWLTKTLSKPLKKLGNFFTRRRLNIHLSQQHSIKSPRDAYVQADQVHSRLSQRLGDNLFFNSQPGRAEYPRSTDIVVAAYLSSELTYLESSSHIKDSFNNYQNLKDFYQRVTRILHERCNFSVRISTPPPEAQYFAPEIPRRTVRDPDVESIRYRLSCKQPSSKQAETPYRRMFFTTAAGFFFALALLTRTKLE